MRDPRHAGMFVDPADPEREIDGDYRALVPLDQEDRQPVRQPVLDDSLG